MNRSRRNTKRPDSKKFQKDQDRSEKVSDKRCANDPSWYIRTGQLAKDVASISFNNAAGARTILGNDNPFGDITVTDTGTSIPGIMAIHTMPAMGAATGPSAPINIAAKNLYTYVRHANSGHSNYDSPDLMLYVMAMDSVYSGIAHLQRAIGTANLFSQVNRYTMDAMLQAEGFNPASVRENLADCRARLNMLILKANSFCIPNTMTLFLRHMWMYTTIFQDSPVAKSQFYLYRPDFLYKYVETSGGPGYLDPIMMDGAVNTDTQGSQFWLMGNHDINLWFTRVESLLTPLIESEDINIMSGDILKAYGRENIFQMSPITEDYVTVPFYSEEVLDQIHNTVFSSSYFRTVSDLTDSDQVKKWNSASFRYTQVVSNYGNYLICGPKVANTIYLAQGKLLDMADDVPTPERVLVATRNMITGSSSATQVSGVNAITSIEHFASDICIYATIYAYGIYSGAWLLSNSPTYNDSLAYSYYVEKFEKAPIGYRGNYQNGVYVPQLPYYELGNYTCITSETLSKMHESAILSMLGVPV